MTQIEVPLETRIAWVAELLGPEARRELWEYAELLYIRQLAAETTEEMEMPAAH